MTGPTGRPPLRPPTHQVQRGQERASAPGVQRRLLEAALARTYGHPRLRMTLREGWGLVREAATRCGLSRVLEPPEFRDLRRLRTAPPAGHRAKGRLLVLSFRGWSTHVVTEAVIANAFRVRGWEVVSATCGGRLPVCDVTPIHSAPPMPCHSCRAYAAGALGAAGLDPLTLSDLVDVRAVRAAGRNLTGRLGSVADCAALTYGGLPLGELVRTSVAWFLSRGTVREDAETLRVYRAFLTSGIVLHTAFTRLLDRARPDRILLLNGAFFAERILAELADRRGIAVTRYEKGFLTDSVLVSRWRRGVDDLDPGDEAWAEARETPLRDDQRARVQSYLDERVRGGRTFDNFWSRRTEELALIRAQLGLPEGRPLVGLFTNILWDSATQGKDAGFGSMAEWLVETVRWVEGHPEVDLVVRIHPAEVRLANHVSREPMEDLIDDALPRLPANVRIVPPESTISSYALIEMCNVGLVYTSTMGLEMAARGLTVICAAAAHYGRRGFTVDPASVDEYLTALGRAVITPVTALEREGRRELALRYSHLFFFRFHQMLDVVHEEARSRPNVCVVDATELREGHSPSLDRVVRGIWDGVDRVLTPLPESV